MAWKKNTNEEEFKINFTSMNQATEWLIVRAAWVRINAAIMGRYEKLSATEQLAMMIPEEWKDKKFKEEMDDLETTLGREKNQCIDRTDKYDNDKLNNALDKYADGLFKAVWNLLSRIGKLPQKSEISEED